MAGWRRVGILGVLALVPLLSGCWLQVGHGPAHRRYNPDETALTRANVETLTQAWSTSAAGAFSEPMVDGRQVYASWADFSSSGGTAARVRALDLESGATAWQTPYFSLSGRFMATAGAPALVGDQVWVGAQATSYLSPPACATGDARLASADGSVVSSATGTLAYSPAVAAGGAVVRVRQACGGGTPVLEVRDEGTAAERWTAELPSGVLGLPTVVDGRIVVAEGTRLVAFPLAGCGAATCDPEWTADLGVRVDLRAPVGGFAGQVFVTSSPGTGASEIIAVDGATGDERWRAPAGTAAGGLAVTEETVFVAVDDTLRAFDAAGCGAATCDPLWTASLGTGVRGEPVTAGGLVYVGTTGAVRAFDAAGCGAASCEALVSLPVHGDVSALSVARGRLFVSSRTSTGSPPFITVDGRLTAFAPA